MPEPLSAIAQVLQSASRALDALQIRWYVFGALAVTAWSRPRITADVDITARVPDDAVNELCSALEQQGFSLRVRDRESFLAKTRVLPFLHTPTGMPLDLVLAGPGIEELFLGRALAVDIEGVSVPVASPEDLIVMKVLAGRAKDLEDVRSLLAAKLFELDVAQIRELLSMLEQALHQSDLMPVWERELAAAQSSR